jgi:hypothetical protein
MRTQFGIQHELHLQSDNQKAQQTKQHVSFATHNTVQLYKDHEEPFVITYDSGSDGNYLSEKDRIKAGLPILRPSTRMVGVANGGTSQAQYITRSTNIS